MNASTIVTRSLIAFSESVGAVPSDSGKLPAAYEIMRQSDPRQFAIPSIVAAELEFGIGNSTVPEKIRLQTERILAPYQILPFDATCARAYGAVRAQLKAADTPIGPNDMLIAATAIANQAVLVTRNVSEFKRVSGLRLESWHDAELPANLP